MGFPHLNLVEEGFQFVLGFVEIAESVLDAEIGLGLTG
jgi:hypothetical protein